MKIKMEGEEQLKRNLLSLGRDMDKALANGVFITANQIRTEAIKSIQTHSFGTYVKRSRQGGGTYDHVAAAAGSAPNTDTGKLVASIAVEMDWKKREAFVGTNLDYGAWLEEGTKKMDARPWLEPAARNNNKNLNENINKGIMAVIKQRSKK